MMSSESDSLSTVPQGEKLRALESGGRVFCREAASSLNLLYSLVTTTVTESLHST